MKKLNNPAIHISVLLALTLFPALPVWTGNVNAQPRDVIVHDPMIIQQDDMYYLFCTGPGVARWASRDLEEWKLLNQVFETAPEWTSNVVPEFGNHMWAPNINYHEETYYLYYSVSSFGRNNSAIGVATNTTLHQDDENYEWTDHGIVVESVPGRDMFNAIDPNLVFDTDDTPWLSFGSFWMGLKIVRMADNLLEIATDPQEWATVASRYRYWKLDERDAGDAANPELDYEELYPQGVYHANVNTLNGAVEAPFIVNRNGYYYLFASWDRCCRGVESTYKIVVGRAEKITGPYLDKTDQQMNHGGGTLVARGNEAWAAVGHNSVLTIDGTDYLVFHGYDKSVEGRPKLWISEVTWDDDGWPVISLDD